jgi:hypothetical protein
MKEIVKVKNSGYEPEFLFYIKPKSFSMIKRIFWRSTCILLYNCFITVNCFGQFDSIKNSLTAWQANFPQEKVFVQTDKSWYLAGEDIWMKAWCVTHEGPTFLSRILYVDLSDSNGRVVQKKMYRLDSLGSTAADITLSKELASGNYTVNGYTLWMLNFPGYVFSKNIFIYGNDYKTTYKSPAGKRASLLFQFFPEGGNIIAGVENRLAFKATDNEGFPVQCKGFIEDGTGRKIIDIATEHDGLGVATFTPETGQQYTAVIPAGGTGRLPFKLPVAKTEGISLQVNNSNPNRLFVVINRTDNQKAKYNILKIVAQINYRIVYTAMLNLDEGQMAASINKKGLPPGIMQITVFNQNDMPLAERLTFIENYQFISPQVHFELLDKKAKGKNRISFDTDGETLPSLSCIVTSYNPADSGSFADNIAASLLFGSELKGYIFNPGYYIKDKSPVTLHHLDLLLMTQGWRRFEWKKLMAREYSDLKYPVESSISFRGTMFKSDRKEIVKDGRISFIIKGADSTSILAEATVTDKGEFLLTDIHYQKNATVAYMGTNNKKEKFIVDVKLLPNYIDSLKRSTFRPVINLDTADIMQRNNSLFLYLNAGLNAIDTQYFKTLGNVTVKAKKLSRIDSLNTQYATGTFLMGKSIDPSDFKHYSTIWQMIQAGVPGITVEGNPFDPVVTINRFSGLAVATDATDGSGSSEPNLSAPTLLEEGGIAYFLNEVNVSKDIINTLSVNDIALIKVLKNEAAGLGVTQGAIAIYTKIGVSAGERIYDKSFTQEEHQGYAIVKEFFSPDYTNPDQLKENDSRYTLYWNGRIQPAKDGKYRFEFYNNDINQRFKLVIQGIDKDGQLIFKEQVIE